jgi:hypothetical protein
MRKSFYNFVYPQGKVHGRYAQYVGWSAVSTFCISAETVLSTHSMLATVGMVSNELAVSTNYIGKDILGQIFGIFYMHKVGSSIDTDQRRFIRNSMIIQQLSTLMECSTPLLPTVCFLPVAAIANAGKNVSFMGFGAINATIIQKLALENNTGEIYAKLTVINTVSSTLGMGTGLVIAGLVPSHSMRMLIVPILGVARYVAYTKSIEGLTPPK